MLYKLLLSIPVVDLQAFPKPVDEDLKKLLRMNPPFKLCPKRTDGLTQPRGSAGRKLNIVPLLIRRWVDIVVIIGWKVF
jgi:hypothetical protein